MNIRPLLIVIATSIPGLYKLASRGQGRTASARYCYSVWLRHLIMANKNGLSTQPYAVCEIGPGNSLGIGLASIISGANEYYAFDIERYINNKRNVKIFDELVELFMKRERIPDEAEFPMVKPYLESYEFPSHILTDKRLSKALSQDRIESIRDSLLNLGSGNRDDIRGIKIAYFAPWYDSEVMTEGSVDMIYSQAVLEHIDDLNKIYEVLYRWLKPGGFMSHQIDFKCHGTARRWNGHWTYSDFVWEKMKGKMPYLINRQPHSTHINFLRKFNFEVVCDIKIKDTSGVKRKYLAPRFKNISIDDLTTSGAFIQAVKKVEQLSN